MPFFLLFFSPKFCCSPDHTCFVFFFIAFLFSSAPLFLFSFQPFKRQCVLSLRRHPRATTVHSRVVKLRVDLGSSNSNINNISSNSWLTIKKK
jgi:hypothetical protein